MKDKKHAVVFGNFVADKMRRSETALKKAIYGTDGDNPLHIAVKNNDISTIRMIASKEPRLLLEHNLNEFKTPLGIAIINNNLEIVKLLLKYYEESDLNINQADHIQKTSCLHTACLTVKVSNEIILELLNFPSIDVNLKNVDQNTPLHYFCEMTQSLDCDEIGYDIYLFLIR